MTSYLFMTSLLSHQATVWCNGNEHYYVYINTTTYVEARMGQISVCASTSQGPARPKCGRWKHKTQFVPLPPKSGSFSSFSGIREELQFSGIFPENPVGLASMNYAICSGLIISLLRSNLNPPVVCVCVSTKKGWSAISCLAVVLPVQPPSFSNP